MNMVLYYFVGLPFILFTSVVSFIVWEIFSNGRWKERRTQSNPAIHWQNQAIGARCQLRDQEYKSRRQIEELEKQLHEVRKSKKR